MRIPTDQPLLSDGIYGSWCGAGFPVFWGLIAGDVLRIPTKSMNIRLIIKVEPPVKPLEVLKNTD